MISKISIRRIHIEKTDSTNTLARSLANESREDILITTDFQTAGRGQRGNSWESEQGKNLLFSLIIHPQDIPASQQFILCQHISLALCEVLRNYTNNISIKWPNDIYWDNKKIAGILIEHDIEGGYLARTIIGIGLNVNQTNFSSLFQLYSTTKNLKVDQVNLTPAASGHSAIVNAQEVIYASNNISITIKGASAIKDKTGKNCSITLIKN